MHRRRLRNLLVSVLGAPDAYRRPGRAAGRARIAAGAEG